MVDWQSGEILASNKGDVLTYVILEKRDKSLNIWELLFKSILNNTSQKLNLTNDYKASLSNLYLEVCEALERRFALSKVKTAQEDLSSLQFVIFSKEKADPFNLLKAFRQINKILDEMNLTRIDNKKTYDRSDIEGENYEKGL